MYALLEMITTLKNTYTLFEHSIAGLTKINFQTLIVLTMQNNYVDFYLHVTFENEMIKISWNYDSYSNTVFRITCNIDQTMITSPKTVNETMKL